MKLGWLPSKPLWSSCLYHPACLPGNCFADWIIPQAHWAYILLLGMVFFICCVFFFTLQIKIKSKQNQLAMLQAVLCDYWLRWSPSAPECSVVLLAFCSMSLYQASAQGCKTIARGHHVQANQYFYCPPPKAKISQSTFFLYLLSHSNSWNNSKR